MSILSIFRILKKAGKAHREMGEREMIHPTEEDLEEYRREDREDKGIAHHEEPPRREPPIGDPCERCDGEGSRWLPANTGGLSGCRTLCPRCLGTGVEP